MKFKKIKKLTINRRIWLRGEGAEHSALLRPEDQKMCCVGLYLQACGVPKNKLRGKLSADQVKSRDATPFDWIRLATPEDAEEVYEANDDEFSDSRDRERLIARLFKKHGVAVRFVGR